MIQPCHIARLPDVAPLSRNLNEMKKKDVLLVGAGPMAEAYAKVLEALDVNFTVICRSEETARRFSEHTGHLPITGGLNHWLENHPTGEISFAIVATPVETLHHNVLSLISFGCKKILVEKPGALYLNDLRDMLSSAQHQTAEVFIAYNRRFYASVLEAEKIIQQDGGLRSLFFEFTEWSHIIQPLHKGPGVKERWFLANSTHVVDLAFFLSGFPANIHSFTSGALNWHPAASKFAGSGVTENGVMFSYLSDWDAPGRWSVELLTHHHRIYLKPLEKLMIQKKGSVEVEAVNIEDELDSLYKPGLYRMTEAFLLGETDRLCSLQHHIQMMEVYCKMANYRDK